MIYHLLYPLHTSISAFNVFRYITFRTIYASLTAFIICFLLGPWVIKRLRQMQVGQFIREDGPETHYKKSGTPTMGGVLIIGAVVAATLLWANLTNFYIWVALLVIVGFGAIGFADDYSKVTKNDNYSGLSARLRLVIGFVIAGVAGYLAARWLAGNLD